MPAVTRSARETVEQLLQDAVSGVPGDMADCYAPEFVIEMPFAVEPLLPSRTQATREQLRARFQAGTASRRYTHLSEVTIHETANPEVVIVEYQMHGERVSSGEEFSSRYLMVITVRDGYIVHSRDYSDPVAGFRLLGRLPELIEVLSKP
ncbi:MAG TPA: nuclear transport factor 2 family protein [Trebonia sp.]|nr:nuclear transport factor 2 family protein [Trebonia sp.]